MVLGGTGRNFAAGMSGGIAYVLDETGDFVKRCNGEMIQLDHISGTANSTEGLELTDITADMLSDDATRLKALIERYLHNTNSERARTILGDWDDYLPKFLKVTPVDYKRALTELRSEEEFAGQLNVAAGE